MDTRPANRGRLSVGAVALVGTLAAALLAGGCTSYTKKTLYGGDPRDPLTPRPPVGPVDSDVTTAETNSARIGLLPPPVQSAFQHDYNNVTVTNVRMEPTGTGAMFYRIVFIQEGRPGQVVYRSDGRDLADTGETVIVREEESFVPIAKPVSPTTAPAAPAREFQ